MALAYIRLPVESGSEFQFCFSFYVLQHLSLIVLCGPSTGLYHQCVWLEEKPGPAQAGLCCSVRLHLPGVPPAGTWRPSWCRPPLAPRTPLTGPCCFQFCQSSHPSRGHNMRNERRKHNVCESNICGLSAVLSSASCQGLHYHTGLAG